ncbi:MAG: AAA family ATPase [Acidimicrobiales bacterium]
MRVGRAGLSPLMVGRDRPLSRLMSGLDDLAPSVALVGGEAGVGKSRLVREFLDELSDDVLVLAGQADPGALGRPFELLLDAVSEHVPGDDDRLAVVRRRGDQAGEQSPVAERLQAALDLVIEIVDRHRAVVVFEDLHWADSESVALFGQLARPEVGPALLVGTYRPSEISRRHPLADAIPRLERLNTVLHLGLDRLEVGDVQDFLAAVYGGLPPTGWPRPSTPARVGTLTSSRSSSSPPGARTSRHCARCRCPGTWPRWCGVRSTICRRCSAGSSRPPRCWVAGLRSTCWPMSPAPPSRS